jgi:hypothetical protein
MTVGNATLLGAWLEFQRVRRGTPEYEALFWAFEEADELCRNDPEGTWDFILAAWKLDQSKAVAQNLSAGLLEDLLARHGEVVIDRVVAEARSNHSFAFLLGGVWKSQMTEAVWSKVQAAWDRRGWDGNPLSPSES